jgi:hypothetical protein
MLTRTFGSHLRSPLKSPRPLLTSWSVRNVRLFIQNGEVNENTRMWNMNTHSIGQSWRHWYSPVQVFCLGQSIMTWTNKWLRQLEPEIWYGNFYTNFTVPFICSFPSHDCRWFQMIQKFTLISAYYFILVRNNHIMNRKYHVILSMNKFCILWKKHIEEIFRDPRSMNTE